MEAWHHLVTAHPRCPHSILLLPSWLTKALIFLETRHKNFPESTTNKQSDTGLLIWGSQNTPGQKTGVWAAEGWGPAGLAPTHGFPEHSWGHVTEMPVSFRGTEFTHHLQGKPGAGSRGLGLGGPGNPTRNPSWGALAGSARCLWMHNRGEKSLILETCMI